MQFGIFRGGAAMSTIRLYEVPNPKAATVKINFPPDGLPRRHVFSREEMADSALAMGHQPREQDPKLRGNRRPHGRRRSEDHDDAVPGPVAGIACEVAAGQQGNRILTTRAGMVPK